MDNHVHTVSVDLSNECRPPIALRLARENACRLLTHVAVRTAHA